MTNIYDIIYYPDPVLKQTANPIDNIDANIQKQAQMMLDTVQHTGNSVGLAANQVGILNRMMVCEINPDGWKYDDPDATKPEIVGNGGDRRGNPILMMNPEIVKKSDRHSICMEGCLSLPEQFARVERPCDVVVDYIDLNGVKQSLGVSGFDAHVVQHELDHLNGVLFIDYLSKLKRNMLIKKLDKWKKMEGLL